MNRFNWVMFGTNLLMVLLIGGMNMVTPYILRRSLLFGVRVPEAVHQQPEVKALKRRFVLRNLLLMVGMAILATLQFVLVPNATMLGTMYLPLIYVALLLGIYYPFHKQAAAMKQQQNWRPDPRIKADTTSALTKQKLKGLPWGWYIASGLVLLGVVGYILYRYPDIPDRFPTHWDANMQPDKFSDKSLLTVFSLPAIGFITMGIFALSNMAVYRMKLQVSTENPALSFAQHRQYRRIWSHYLGLLTLATAVGMALMTPTTIGLAEMQPVPFYIGLGVYMLLTIVPVIVIYLKAGQSGSKLKPAIQPEDETTRAPKRAVSGQDDDRFWKLGLFYYNKEDPSLFVEDRFGLNVGLNYARPAAKVFVLLMALLIVGTYAIITGLWVTAPEQFM